MGDKRKSVVPAIAREQREAFTANSVVTLSTGVRARILPVPSTLLDKVTVRIPEPAIPTQYIESKGREEPNPFDPAYTAALSDTYKARARAMSEAFIMFGIELLDGVPPDEEWMPKLLYAQRRGLVDFTEYDLTDPDEREYVYKAFVAVSNKDVQKVMVACGLLDEQVSAATQNFPGDKERDAN